MCAKKDKDIKIYIGTHSSCIQQLPAMAIWCKHSVPGKSQSNLLGYGIRFFSRMTLVTQEFQHVAKSIDHLLADRFVRSLEDCTPFHYQILASSALERMEGFSNELTPDEEREGDSDECADTSSIETSFTRRKEKESLSLQQLISSSAPCRSS